jgi:hypothetical protein
MVERLPEDLEHLFLPLIIIVSAVQPDLICTGATAVWSPKKEPDIGSCTHILHPGPPLGISPHVILMASCHRDQSSFHDRQSTKPPCGP